MNSVREDLKKYIEENVFPQYAKNEKAHNLEHILAVIDRSFHLVEENQLDVNPDIVYTVAAYHDIGHHIDPKNHEKISADMMVQDEGLKDFFNEKELTIIQEAIEDHRASSDHEPRSIYGKIVSSADRNHTVNDCLKRTYYYGKKLNPEATDDELFARAYDVLVDKFGENGYAKHYFKDQNYDTFLQKLRDLLKNKDLFIETQRKYIEQLKEGDSNE